VTTSRKAAISLLIAVLLFSGFSVLAFSGLFNLLETRFYHPSVTAHLNRDITLNAGAIDKFFTETRERFSETLKTDTVRHSFLSSQKAEDVSTCSNLYGRLIESFYGLQWVRFVDGNAEGNADANGHRLLFSSYGPDILNSEGTSPVYKDYNEPNLPYGAVAVPEGGTPKYTFDDAGRVIFSFPLYDSFDVYRGTALFSLSADAVSARLVSEGRIKPGEYITVISNPAGLLFGSVPGTERKVHISTRTSQGFLVERLVNEEVFLLPAIMKFILLLAFFLTTYLIVFLLFNLRQDPLVVVQSRLKQLQISLIEQFYERKNEADWERWIRELENRREEVRGLLKRGVKADSDKSADMDILINKSWDELLLMLGSRRDRSAPGETDIDEEKIAAVLQKLLEAARSGVPLTSSVVAADDKTGFLKKASAIDLSIAGAIDDEEKKSESAEKIEVLEELDEAEIAAFATADAASTKLSYVEESGSSPPVSYNDVEILAEKIEFSPDIEPEMPELRSADDEPFEELEIVSPFSAMVFDSSPEQNSGERGSDAGDTVADVAGVAKEVPQMENRDKNEEAGLDIFMDGGLPLITRPFTDFPVDEDIETLEIVNDDNEHKNQTNGDDSIENDDGIIMEKEGVHYISEDILVPSPAVSASLNTEFKELVDEVTK